MNTKAPLNENFFAPKLVLRAAAVSVASPEKKEKIIQSRSVEERGRAEMTDG